MWAKLVAKRQNEGKQHIAAQEAKAARIKQAAAEAKAKQERKAALERAAKEKAEEEACRKDLKCWGNKAIMIAAFSCARRVERLAIYDFEWTNSWGEPKFSRGRWLDIGAGTVTIIDDKIKMQNAFGAWKHMTYECDVDVVKEEVLDVRVSGGRI